MHDPSYSYSDSYSSPSKRFRWRSQGGVRGGDEEGGGGKKIVIALYTVHASCKVSTPSRWDFCNNPNTYFKCTPATSVRHGDEDDDGDEAAVVVANGLSAASASSADPSLTASDRVYPPRS
jgi:hypothetical protein